MLATVLRDLGKDADTVCQEEGMFPQTLSWCGAGPAGMGRRNDRALRASLGSLVMALGQNIDLNFLYTEERWETFGVSLLKKCSKE